MNIFITGASGFIGSRLAIRLVEEGHTISALMRNHTQDEWFAKMGIKIVRGDILNIDSMNRGMAGSDCIFHLAAYTRPVSKEPEIPFLTNVKGTLNVFEAARKCEVSRMIVVSTAGTLGFSPDSQPVDEKSKRPSFYPTEYERTKAQSEIEVMKRATVNPEVIIVNPTRVYGPGRETLSNSVTRIIRLYGKGLWRILPGNGNAIGNYVYIDDVVHGLILASERGRGGERYILGGENLSYNDFFTILGEVYRKQRILIPFGESFLKNIVRMAGIYSRMTRQQPFISNDWIDKYLRNYILSSNKAVTDLNYKITPFREGAAKTVMALNKNR